MGEKEMDAASVSGLSPKDDRIPAHNADNDATVSPPQPTPRRKRKRPVDPNAPKKSLNGYVIFATEKRVATAQGNPGLSATDVTKLLGQMWRELPDDQRQKYLDMAAKQKEEYNVELKKYKQSSSYQEVQSKLQEEKMKKSTKTFNCDGAGTDDHTNEAVTSSGAAIPIFTKDFLEHNKARENELRSLRRQVTSMEEELCALESHLHLIQQSIKQTEEEVGKKRAHNQELSHHLANLRSALVNSFANLPMPDGFEGPPTLATIDQYMLKVHQLILDRPNDYPDFVNTVKSIVTGLKIS